MNEQDVNEAAIRYANHEACQVPGLFDCDEAIKAFKTGSYFGADIERQRARILAEALEWYTGPGLMDTFKAEEALKKYRGESGDT